MFLKDCHSNESLNSNNSFVISWKKTKTSTETQRWRCQTNQFLDLRIEACALKYMRSYVNVKFNNILSIDWFWVKTDTCKLLLSGGISCTKEKWKNFSTIEKIGRELGYFIPRLILIFSNSSLSLYIMTFVCLPAP